MREAFAKAGARLHLSPAPRGQRLREAAALLPLGESPLLLFLHADTILPVGWESAVRAAHGRGAAGGAFRLGFSGGDPRMAWVAAWANLRTRVTKVPYGDQAPFVRRDVYERLGGHEPWPFLEDWDFSRRLVAAEGKTRVEILRERVQTSPQRYLEKGVWKRVRGNWEILRRVKRGEAPEHLAALYRS
ncbi:MAG: glycosyl transferase [Acidobacteriota bacterium]